MPGFVGKDLYKKIELTEYVHSHKLYYRNPHRCTRLQVFQTKKSNNFLNLKSHKQLNFFSFIFLIIQKIQFKIQNRSFEVQFECGASNLGAMTSSDGEVPASLSSSLTCSTLFKTLRKFNPASLFRWSSLHPAANNSANKTGYDDTSFKPSGVLKKNVKAKKINRFPLFLRRIFFFSLTNLYRRIQLLGRHVLPQLRFSRVLYELEKYFIFLAKLFFRLRKQINVERIKYGRKKKSYMTLVS